MRLVFVELPAFARHRAGYLEEGDFGELQSFGGGATSEERAMNVRRGAKRPKKAKRDLFGEIAEGFEALAGERRGRRTLRTHPVTLRPAPEVGPRELAELREELAVSRAVLAACLRTNVRTLENWEQGRARPNAQAALLIRLVRKYPDTVRRLAEI